MMESLIGFRGILLVAFVCSAIYVHFRGRIRHSWTRQLSDHSTFLAPINTVLYTTSAVPNTPFLDLDQFPGLKPLQEQWEEIRDEAMSLFDEGHIRAASSHNDVAFHSFFRNGWKRFYLKWYDDPQPSAQLCPKTLALVQSIPAINAAMFAFLPAGSNLGAHRDPYAGSLRYHLGLVTPNSDDCAIVVDGQTYSWRDGEAVLFDETFIHHAYNRTQQDRLILFCDIERPLRYRLASYFNHFFKWTLIRSAQAPNSDGEKVGGLNRIFDKVYHLRLKAKAYKKTNKTGYYVGKWVLLGGLFYLVFLS